MMPLTMLIQGISSISHFPKIFNIERNFCEQITMVKENE